MLPGNTIYIGDFNCPGKSSCEIDVHLSDIIGLYSLKCCDGPATRLSDGARGGRLDLIVHNLDDVTNPCTIEVGFTDHCLVRADFRFAAIEAAVVSFRCRNLKRINYEELEEELWNCSFITDPADTVDGFIDQLHHDVTVVLDRTAPFHDTKVRTGKRRTVNLNQEATRAKRHRRRCEKRYQRSNSEADRIIYRKACRDANRLIIGAQRDAIQAKLTLAGNDQREVWRISNDLLHCCDRRQNMDNAESLCSNFRQFFIGKLQTIRAKIQSELISFGSVLLRLVTKPARVLDSFTDTTPEEVAKDINGIKCKNSPTDIIPTVVIKRCVNVFSSALSHAINMSFSSGIFPGIFKIGHVVPLLKKPGSDANEPGNYRPITNLMTISKVFEKLVLARLRPHLHGSSIFSSHQSAYRSGHFTETATLKVADDLNSNMENKSCSLLLSLDISAAFDMLDQSCPRVTFLGPDPTRPGETLTRPHPTRN